MEEMMDAGVDAPELEINEVDTETSTDTQPEPQSETPETPEDPYSPKSASEYSKFLKSLRDADPANAKFARQAKDDFARGIELKKIEPAGVAGVREKYALLDSLMHGDAKGVDALSAMQDEIQTYADIDQRIVNGDASTLQDFDDAMKQGIVKMAPAILDMARTMDPEGYQSTLASHMVESLRTSPLVTNFNGLVDVLNEQMPSWLPEDKKQAWQADKFQRIVGLAANMSNGFNALQEKATQLKPVGQNGKATVDEERQSFDKERQDYHWETKISPNLDKHASEKFKELFSPYGKRLRLDAPAQSALMNEFSKRVAATAAKNQQYMSQISRYRSTKNPDPAAVINYAKVEFDKHATNVMKGLIEERYKPFLNGTKQNGAGNQQSKPAVNGNKGPVSPNVQIVSVKPPSNEIDWARTNADMIHAKKYRMLDGSTRQVRQ